MHRSIALLALVVGAALPTATGVANADEASYSKCIDMSLQHLGVGAPANMGPWVELGRTVDQNLYKYDATPQSQVSYVEGLGWDHVTAGAIVQCVLSNTPI